MFGNLMGGLMDAGKMEMLQQVLGQVGQQVDENATALGEEATQTAHSGLETILNAVQGGDGAGAEGGIQTLLGALGNAPDLLSQLQPLLEQVRPLLDSLTNKG